MLSPMTTRNAWIAIVLLVGALLACKKKEEDKAASGLAAARKSYMLDLGVALGKECDVSEEVADSAPGLVVACETDESLERTKTQVKEDCPKIKSAGFKKVRAYVNYGSGVKGSVDIGCAML
jgi:hypothetical protein